jgi:hypothetical protein
VPFCHTKIPTLPQILHTLGVGLLAHEFNTLVHFTRNWKWNKKKHLKTTNTLQFDSTYIVAP